MKQITDKLFELRDEKFAAFNRRLLPTVDPEKVIGVRTPELRDLAKRLISDACIGEFLCELPHTYFEENNLHAFIIEQIPDYDDCLDKVIAFLSYVDNWATCDQMSPKVFKNKPSLIENIEEWISSDRTYTIRFGISMLMKHFSDELFDKRYLDLVSSIKSDEFYVQMMAAWYFATLLAKQYDATMPYFVGNKLSIEVRSKAIAKAVESSRISPQIKRTLRALKRE